MDDSSRLVPVDGLPPETRGKRCDEFYFVRNSEPGEADDICLHIKIDQRSYTAQFEDGTIVWKSDRQPFRAEDDAKATLTVVIQDIAPESGLRGRLMEKMETRSVPEGYEIAFLFSDQWSEDISRHMRPFLVQASAERETIRVLFAFDGSVGWRS